MPVCPQCHTPGQPFMAPCPNCDGLYLVPDEALGTNRGNPYLGRAIGGRFVVVGKLGEGSMAQVYEAFQLEVERPVALKVFQVDDVASESARSRFAQEARVLGKLAHPNCVTLFDFGADDRARVLYIAMERVSGVSLRRIITRGVTTEAVVEIVRQVALALSEAHALGIVHRDLKPENIIVSFRPTTQEPVVKVVDFGIAKLLGGQFNKTRVGALFGTPAYMSPEQCRGDTDQIGPHSDVYSLGCILFELLTGRLPFEGRSPAEMLQMHNEAAVPMMVPRAGVQIPPDLHKLVTRAMQKEAPYRVTTSELVRILEAMSGAEQRRAPTTGAHRVVVPDNQISGIDIAPPIRAHAAEIPQALATPAISQEMHAVSVLETHRDEDPAKADATRGIDQSRIMKATSSDEPTVWILAFIVIVVLGGLSVIAALFFL